MSHSRASNLSAGRIALGYAVISILWIVFSDALVTWLNLHPVVMTFKGTFFVLVTASLLFFTIRRLVQAIELTSQERDETAKRYAVTLASIGDAVIATDTQARITFLNPAAESLTGWPLSQAIGRPLADVFHIINEQSRQLAEDPAAKVLRSGALVGLANHTALLARDGRETPIDDCGAPILDDGGRIAGVVLVFRDVTQRRRAEEADALRRANERMELALRGSNVYVWEIEMSESDFLHGRLHHVNFWEQLGYGSRPADGIEPTQTPIHPDDIAPRREAMRAYLAGETTELESEVRFRHADGSTRIMVVRGAAVRDAAGKPSRMLGTGVDITGLKHAEDALRASEARFRALVQNSSDIVVLFDAEGVVRYQSPSFARLLGYRPDEWIGRKVSADPIVHPDEQARVNAFVEAVRRAQGAPVKGEFRLLHADGSWRDVETIAQSFLHDPAVAGMVANYRDITERKRVDRALQASEARFRALVQNSSDIILLFDAAGTVLYQSPSIERLLGYPPDQWIGRSVFHDPIVHPDDRAAKKVFFETARDHRGAPVTAEFRLRHADGSWRHVEAVGQSFLHNPGVAGVVANYRDVSAQRRAEQTLRDSERRFRVFVDHAADAFFLTDLEGRIRDVNQRACENLGYTRDELLAMTAFDFDPHLDTVEVEERIRRLVSGETIAWESRQLRKDGTAFPVEVRSKGFREGDRDYFVSLVRDVTDRKLAEEAAAERTRLASLAADVGMALTGADTLRGILQPCAEALVRHLDAAFARIWTFNEAENAMDLRASAGLYTRIDGAFSRVPVNGPFKIGLIVQQRRPYLTNDVLQDPLISDIEWARREGMIASAGHPLIVQDRVVGVMVLFARRPLPEATLKALAAVADEIALGIERVRQEEALLASEQRFRGTFENAAVGIAHVDPATGRYLRVNERFCTIVGYPYDELIQKTVQDVTHPDDLAASVALLGALSRGELPRHELENRYVRKDGSVVWGALWSAVQWDPAGHPAYCISVLQDVSDRKRLEGELRHAKDAAVAANRAKDEFLANVSHEIRTPMNAILGMTELTLDTELTEDQRQCMETVKAAADNLLGIINDLLDFAKIEAGKLELDVANFSLRTVVGDTLRALAVRAHKKGLELIYDVQPDVPDALVGDAIRLRQVLLNLVGNAIKFTHEGEVDVRAEVSTLVADELSPDDVALRFAVRDTGIGIPRDQQERIFRAFEQEDTSTTRRYGGTGLGLTISARLVALMGGTIAVQSEPNRGSTFTFIARFARQPLSSEPVAVSPREQSGRQLRNLPVLVVDDNATNRHILEEWLRGWHMHPTAVAGAAAALETLSQAAGEGRPYPLVLLDARMPDMDGLTLAAEIRQQPDLHAMRIILLTSGDRPGDLARSRKQRVDAHLLKPIEQTELLETICRVVSGTGRGSMPAVTIAAAAERAATDKPLRVLAAEDSELNASLLKRLLARRGHHVQLAGDGRRALALASQGGFDLLLLDIHLPELDGFEVARAVRENERKSGGHLPIIALTARARKEDRQQCLAAGMDDYLAKPVRAADLWAAIDRILGAGRAAEPSAPGLLAPHVLLAACGDDAATLEEICQTFRECLPGHLQVIRNAVQDEDASRLREAAHKLAGMVAIFSTVASGVASQIEDIAAQGQVEEARPLVEQLMSMTPELMQLTNGLSLAALRRQSGSADLSQ